MNPPLVSLWFISALTLLNLGVFFSLYPILVVLLELGSLEGPCRWGAGLHGATGCLFWDVREDGPWGTWVRGGLWG